MNEFQKNVARKIGFTWSDGAFGIANGLFTGLDVAEFLNFQFLEIH